MGNLFIFDTAGYTDFPVPWEYTKSSYFTFLNSAKLCLKNIYK